jgi:hypothetical protein
MRTRSVDQWSNIRMRVNVDHAIGLKVHVEGIDRWPRRIMTATHHNGDVSAVQDLCHHIRLSIMDLLERLAFNVDIPGVDDTQRSGSHCIGYAGRRQTRERSSDH